MSIHFSIFLAFLSYTCTLPSLSHIPAFLCIPAGPFSHSLEVCLSYKDMHHHARHPYLCLKCRPSCTHLFCFHTLSAHCSFSDTGMSFPVSPCCSYTFYLGTQAFSPTFSCLSSHPSSSHAFPACLLCGPFSSCQHSQLAGRGCQLETKQSLGPSSPATLFNPLLIFLLFL